MDVQKIYLPILLSVALVGGTIFLATKIHTRPAGDTGQLRIVAAENVYGDVARQIGGNKVTVTSILSDPNTDPHLYESDAQAAAAVTNADIVIKNGLSYDDFMDKLLSTANRPERIVLTAADILRVSGADANPHLWYDIPRMQQVAQAIEAALAQKDPADQQLFTNNLAAFTSSLQPTLRVIETIKAQQNNAPVGYTERVPGYLLADAGLRVVSPVGFAQAIEAGNEPSPADTLAFQQLIAHHQIKILLYNAQVTSPATQSIQTLAHQAGVPVVGVSETIPRGETYQTWQLTQTQAILAALGRTNP